MRVNRTCSPHVILRFQSMLGEWNCFRLPIDQKKHGLLQCTWPCRCEEKRKQFTFVKKRYQEKKEKHYSKYRTTLSLFGLQTKTPGFQRALSELLSTSDKKHAEVQQLQKVHIYVHLATSYRKSKCAFWASAFKSPTFKHIFKSMFGLCANCTLLSTHCLLNQVKL